MTQNDIAHLGLRLLLIFSVLYDNLDICVVMKPESFFLFISLQKLGNNVLREFNQKLGYNCINNWLYEFQKLNTHYEFQSAPDDSKWLVQWKIWF